MRVEILVSAPLLRLQEGQIDLRQCFAEFQTEIASRLMKSFSDTERWKWRKNAHVTELTTDGHRRYWDFLLGESDDINIIVIYMPLDLSLGASRRCRLDIFLKSSAEKEHYVIEDFVGTRREQDKKLRQLWGILSAIYECVALDTKDQDSGQKRSQVADTKAKNLLDALGQ